MPYGSFDDVSFASENSRDNCHFLDEAEYTIVMAYITSSRSFGLTHDPIM